MTDWVVTEPDHELFDRELASFVPDRIFDGHAHWYRTIHFAEQQIPPLLRSGPRDAGASEFAMHMQGLIPDRSIRGLFFPFPHASLDVHAANLFVAEETRRSPGSFGQMLVTPDMDPEFIRENVRRFGFSGLKCYHVYASKQPTFEATIEEFLPERQVQVAHQERLTITLHIVRSRALADPGNQQTLRSYCERYPDVRLILAHAARGFNPHHTLVGIESLRGLGNIWFDSSAVTDCGALESIIRVFGSDRLIYGSDFPVSHLRGRCVALGDSFFWISSANTDLAVPYGQIRLAFVGHESLRCLKIAVMATGLSDTQTEDVFFRNASKIWAAE